MKPSRAIVKLAVPATLALLAKADYNIVDTTCIGMLYSDAALTNLPALNMICAARAESTVRVDGDHRVAFFTFFLLACFCLSAASLLTNIAASPLPDCNAIIAVYAFGVKNEERFHQCVRFALMGALVLTVLACILLSRPLTLLSIRPMKRISSKNMSQS